MNGNDAQVFDVLLGEMVEYMDRPVARGILNAALKQIGLTEERLEREGVSERLIRAMHPGVRLFVRDENKKQDCLSRLNDFMRRQRLSGEAVRSSFPEELKNIAKIDIKEENDIVVARSQARNLAAGLGFNSTEQIKIATAVSELARNIYKYAGQGTVEIQTLHSPRVGLKISAVDNGPGIKNLEEIMSGGYKSKTGLGLGLMGCKKLMDDFDIISNPQSGTAITLHKYR